MANMHLYLANQSWLPQESCEMLLGMGLHPVQDIYGHGNLKPLEHLFVEEESDDINAAYGPTIDYLSGYEH